MKMINEFVRYQYKQYLLSAKWVIPFIVLLAVFRVMYSILPIDVVSNFSIMSLVLFLIMVGIGMTCQGIEPEVSEQIIILRMQSERKYYIGQVLFLGTLRGIAAAICLCYPVIGHYCWYGKMLFTRNMYISDIIGGLLLMFACSFLGCMLGAIFSPRIIRESKIRFLLAIVFALISVVRIGIVAEVPISKYILWIVPPVSDVVGWFMKEEYFQMGKITGAFFILMVYGIALATIKVEWSKIRKF